jgi:hypothetical protein
VVVIENLIFWGVHMMKRLLFAVVVFGLASASLAKASPINPNDGPGNPPPSYNQDDGKNSYNWDSKNDDDNGPSLPGGGNNDCDPGGPTDPTSPAPEPSSLMLLGTGALGLAGVVRRRFNR